MTVDKNHIEKLCNTVAETIVGVFGQITIDDVNMYKLGYNKAIDNMVYNLIRNSTTEEINGKICLIVTEKRIKIVAEQLKKSATNE